MKLNNLNFFEVLTLYVNFKILWLHSIQSQENMSKKLFMFLSILAHFECTPPPLGHYGLKDNASLIGIFES